MRPLTVGSLFSGIGGIDLGLERAGMVTRWFSEIDPYASRLLAKHWPTVPNHGDITKIDFRQVEPVDVLCGGFPCQDLSSAGNGAGIDGKKSGLWREYVRAIRCLAPRYILAENVSRLISGDDGLWFARVLGDLAALGYDAEWDCLPAAGIGAPHIRDRTFVLAYTQRDGWDAPAREGLARELGRGATETCRRGEEKAAFPVHRGSGFPRWASTEEPGSHDAGDHSRQNLARHWMVEPDVGRVADGVPGTLDRIRGLGNAVVPQIPELIGGWIIEHARATGYLEVAA